MAKAEGGVGAGARKTLNDTQLYRAALEGDWRFAANTQRNIINRAITNQGETALHIAAMAGHEKVVQELLRRLNEEDLEHVNLKGSNALCYAAISGNLKVVKQMLEAGSKRLPNPGSGVKPLMMAASLEHHEIVRYLFDKTYVHDWTQDQQADLFTTCISIGVYDVALTMLDRNPKLATSQDKYAETALLVLSRMPPPTLASESQPGLFKRLVDASFHRIFPGKGSKLNCSRKPNQSPARELLQKLCRYALESDEESQIPSIEEAAKLLFQAAEVGNVDFLIYLIRHNPDLLWVKDNQGGSVFHVAVKNRHEAIFSLWFQLGAIKDLIAKRVIEGENNLLHLAAKLAPQNKLSTVSGAAFQMHRELLWFKAVEKIVPNSYRDMKNSDGYTPRALFMETHKCLRQEGERWMKETAKASLLVATLLAIVLFSVHFSVPGRFDYSGQPVLQNQNLSGVFLMSDAIGLVASSTSMLMFLSILTSRYAEIDFLVSVPFKLMIGFTSLFISVSAMVVAFSASFLSKYVL
ncbi:hypothetical protein FNV43_RR00700 [Rhamnella rubrinervis]|uniref:PGG domain-containing protein n=1 Tax=Rhamnella rubrinervis TaxID=2594499 RepID=A0A8K0HNH9_9ROSA|nr:hypothetical protein FNV43_RR00700 [Rhamnella rubrinervis]